MSEPSDDEAAMLGEIGREVVTIRQPRVDGMEVGYDSTDATKIIAEVVLRGRFGIETIGLVFVSVFPISLSLRFAITTRQMIGKPRG